MSATDKNFYPEVQGLRAVSVLAVIAFHFHPALLPGGYIGVDMFFVISGFIITRIIAGDIAGGSFSVLRFYRNRVVRLLPNLFVMIAVSVVIAWFVLRPHDFRQYAKSLQASALYVTNLVFARQQGYFDMSRDVKPLLHTWSLSIEEQFYLVFPFFLVLLYRLRAHRGAVLATLALLSLWVQFDLLRNDLPIQGFFSSLGRAWEFLIGASVALLPAATKERLAGNEWLSLAALLMIAGSLVLIDETLPYSGLWVALPCLATAVAIACGAETQPGRVLSGRALVFIGGLSYSLYLWHWPLMVWVKNADLDLEYGGRLALLTALTAVVAYLCWKYVEQPFRERRDRIPGKAVAAVLACFAIFCLGAGQYIYANGGLEERFPNYVEVRKNLESFDFEAATGSKLAYPAGCRVGDRPEDILRGCAFGDASAGDRFLLLGDSHAEAWYPAFQAAAERKNWQGIFVSLTGCPPLFGITSWLGSKNICPEKFDERIGALIETRQIRKVFLVAHWHMYAEGMPNDQPNHFISDAQAKSRDAASSKDVLARRLTETIRRMQDNGIEVIVVLSPPVLAKGVQQLPADFAQPVQAVRSSNGFVRDAVARHADAAVRFIDPAEVFCNSASCATRLDGRVLYTDNNHISRAGAAILVPLVASRL